MIHLCYALEEMALQEYLRVKDDLSAYKQGRTPEEIQAGIAEIYASAALNRSPPAGQDPRDLYQVDREGVAHIPVTGMLTASANPCAAFFGESVTEYGFIQAALQAADADPRVKAIAIEVNSPGGTVEGVDRTAQVIAGLSSRVTAYVHDVAASAAYWLASQADWIVALTPASRIGSIGVMAELIDRSGSDQKAGITRRVFTSTEAPDKLPDPATESGRIRVIKMLDDMHAVFAQRVAGGRGVSVEKVNADFGRGGMLIAADALAAGMIDQITSITKVRTGGVAPAAAAGAANITDKGAHMTLEEMKAKEPDLYAAAVKVGREEVAGEFVTVKGERDTLLGKTASLEKALELSGVDLAAARAQEFGRRKTVALEGALKEGRIKPVDKDFWAGRLDKDLAGTEEILAKLPVNPLFRTLGTGEDPGEPAGGDEVEVHKGLKAMGYSDNEIKEGGK